MDGTHKTQGAYSVYKVHVPKSPSNLGLQVMHNTVLFMTLIIKLYLKSVTKSNEASLSN